MITTLYITVFLRPPVEFKLHFGIVIALALINLSTAAQKFSELVPAKITFSRNWIIQPFLCLCLDSSCFYGSCRTYIFKLVVVGEKSVCKPQVTTFMKRKLLYLLSFDLEIFLLHEISWWSGHQYQSKHKDEFIQGNLLQSISGLVLHLLHVRICFNCSRLCVDQNSLYLLASLDLILLIWGNVFQICTYHLESNWS